MVRLAGAALLLFLAPAVLAQNSAQDRLWDASIAGDSAAVAQALADGADVNALDTRRSRNGRRALNWAASNNHVAVVALLLEHGAELEGRNLTGFTALHHAAEFGAVDALHVLLGAGADPTAANNRGQRPIDTARRLGHVAIVQALQAVEER